MCGADTRAIEVIDDFLLVGAHDFHDARLVEHSQCALDIIEFVVVCLTTSDGDGLGTCGRVDSGRGSDSGFHDEYGVGLIVLETIIAQCKRRVLSIEIALAIHGFYS